MLLIRCAVGDVMGLGFRSSLVPCLFERLVGFVYCRVMVLLEWVNGKMVEKHAAPDDARSHDKLSQALMLLLHQLLLCHLLDPRLDMRRIVRSAVC